MEGGGRSLACVTSMTSTRLNLAATCWVAQCSSRGYPASRRSPISESTSASTCISVAAAVAAAAAALSGTTLIATKD